MHLNKEVYYHRNNCNFQESHSIWGGGVCIPVCEREGLPGLTRRTLCRGETYVDEGMAVKGGNKMGMWDALATSQPMRLPVPWDNAIFTCLTSPSSPTLSNV